MSSERSDTERGPLKAPFPWFGGKSRVASLVWRRLGDVGVYIEPFLGSAAVLLARPGGASGIETVNDLDCHLANFWRATQADPEGVVEYADWPINEADLYARHRWLVMGEGALEFREHMLADPDHYDCRRAGWWVWGLSAWIGRGWCRDLERQIPYLSDTGKGIHRQRPHLSDAGKGVHRQIPHLGSAGRGVHRQGAGDRRRWLLDWLGRLRDRFRRVRVCCGSWERVCSSETTTTKMGICGVLLDPPYSAEAGRDGDLYACEDLSVAHDVRRWCLERGGDRRMRIALCGYEGEGHEELEARGWRVEAWKARGGYGNQSDGAGRANARRERIWFSPGCCFEPSLFDHLEES